MIDTLLPSIGGFRAAKVHARQTNESDNLRRICRIARFPFDSLNTVAYLAILPKPGAAHTT